MFQWLKNWWDPVECPIHKVPYMLQGYEERKVCPECWDEAHRPSKDPKYE